MLRGHRRLPRALWPALTVVTGGAAYYAFGVLWERALRGQGLPTFDTYAYFYPNYLYALRSLREGGLLWNPYQDCGQPFYAISQTGLLYPVNVVFALLDREPALLASVVINLGIAGTGTFLLCRELRLGVVASLCGALAFQLGGTAAMLAAWSPMHLAPYVWIPAAMWRLERLLRRPSIANGAWLGVVLTVQLLPGFPQTVFFTYQLLALRIAWAVLARRRDRPLAVLGAAGFGCVLPLVLGAVQLLPSIEVARNSLRSLPLQTRELGFSYTWDAIRTALALPERNGYPGTALVLAVAMVSGIGLCRRKTRGLTIFYLGVVVLYTLLSFGPDGVVFSWYAKLPLGSAFRMPMRLLWVCGFALAVLTALGVDALLCGAAAETIRARGKGSALLTAGALLFFALVQRPPTPMEWLLLAALALAAVLVAWSGPARLSAVIVLGALFLNLAATSRLQGLGQRLGDLYGANADAFALLRERLTAQDRVAIVGTNGDFTLMPKSASLFRVASVFDYEPQVSRAYADYFIWMRVGRGLRSIGDWYYMINGPLPQGFNEGLLDLTAARYVIVGRAAERTTGRSPSWRVLEHNARWTIYENPQALQRARFVPRIEVVPEESVLPVLARGAQDPSGVAFVSQAPGSGFRGRDGEATGAVAVVANEPERVVVQVDATAPGFLVLADQYADGWEARVDGARAEILRANHAFRAVEVPAGRSQVVFRYRPLSLYVGAGLSAVSAALLLAAAIMRARRRRVGPPEAVRRPRVRSLPAPY